MTTNHHRHAQQLLAQALAATTLQQRRQALRAALAQQRAALATATATATQSPETVARVWLQAGILRLLQGALPAAKAACLSARPGLANPREVDWLEAEVAVLAGDHADAMQLLLPRLDDAPDGWVLAALAAHAGQLLQPMQRLVAEAEQRLGAGFVAPHRVERWQDAQALLSILRAEPQPGEGPYGQLAALMCGEYRRVLGGDLRGADVALVTTQLRALLLAGRTDLLVPLLQPQADTLLPGIGALVSGVVGGIVDYLPTS